MEIKTKYNIEQLVYLKHDPEQRQWMIVSILVFSYKIIRYNLVCGTEEFEANQFELSAERNEALYLDYNKNKGGDVDAGYYNTETHGSYPGQPAPAGTACL